MSDAIEYCDTCDTQVGCHMARKCLRPKATMSNTPRKTLPNDIARCDGDGFDDGSGIAWREGCETCLRRTAPRPKEPIMIKPPAIIAFECEYLIEP